MRTENHVFVFANEADVLVDRQHADRRLTADKNAVADASRIVDAPQAAATEEAPGIGEIDGRKRKHDAAEMMARIVAGRLVEYLERAGFVVMKKPPIAGSAPRNFAAPPSVP